MSEGERPLVDPAAVVGMLDADEVLDREAPHHQFAHAGGVVPTPPAEPPAGAANMAAPGMGEQSSTHTAIGGRKRRGVPIQSTLRPVPLQRDE
eukprot:1641612-Alexandrium_andersonii.AAC.1